jgi:transposase
MTTETSTEKDDRARRAAVKLLARGLASPSEVAKLAGVSRQLVNHWASSIDWRRARNEALAKAWRKLARP